MLGSCRVQLGNLWGGFRVGSNKALPLVNPGEFKISDKGAVELSARYDPPGSGWRALIAAIATGIVITIAAQATGFCAGPGWLLWYILIVQVRRRPATLTLAQADSVVVDAGNRRLGFFIDFLGGKNWVAFEIPGEQFHDALQSLKATTFAQISEGQIKRRLKGSTIAIIVMVGLMVVLMIFAIVFPLMYRTRQRPRIDVAPSGNSKLDYRRPDMTCHLGYDHARETDDTNT